MGEGSRWRELPMPPPRSDGSGVEAWGTDAPSLADNHDLPRGVHRTQWHTLLGISKHHLEHVDGMAYVPRLQQHPHFTSIALKRTVCAFLEVPSIYDLY